MAKNYTIEYLSAMRELLLDMANELDNKIHKIRSSAENGDNTSMARKHVKEYSSDFTIRISSFKADSRNLTYTDFREKHLKSF